MAPNIGRWLITLSVIITVAAGLAPVSRIYGPTRAYTKKNGSRLAPAIVLARRGDYSAAITACCSISLALASA